MGGPAHGDAPTPPARGPVVTLLLAALLVRLWGLGARSVWTDEGSVWTAASAPLPDLIRLCATKDASPPLFHLLTKLALLFGDSEVQLRLVSALASVGLVWLTYRLARLFAGRHEALLAAGLAALSPFQLMYAQEARTYTLVAAWTVLGLYLYARAALLGRPRAWWPLTFAVALGLWTQSIALLGVGAQGVLAIVTREGRRHFLRWVLAIAAALVLHLPWLVVSLQQAGHVGQSHWYVDAPDGRGVFQVLRAVFLSPIPLVTAPEGAAVHGLDAVLPRRVAHAFLLLVAAVPLAAAALALRRRDERSCGVAFAAIAVAAPLLAVLAVSSRVPLFLPRYFVFLTPFVAMLTAYGLAALRPAWLGRVLGGLVLLVAAYGCVRVQWDYGKERWREVAATIAGRAVPGRTAVLVTFDVDPYRFYNVKAREPLPAFEVSHPAVPFNSGWTPEQMTAMEDSARARVAGHDEVWVVVRSPNSEPRRAVAALAERAAGDGRALVSRERWDSYGGPLRVAHFRRTHSADSTSLRAAP
jgi:mannosyltransferase